MKFDLPLTMADEVQVDVSKLTPDSPEVIKNQVGLKHYLIVCTYSLIGHNQPRNYWPCRTRQIDSGQGHLWCDDCPIQERTRAKYHNQAW